MGLEPAFDEFAALYNSGKPQVLSTTLVADLETPVSAYLKLAEGRPYSALFESVEGGTTIGIAERTLYAPILEIESDTRFFESTSP